METYFGCACGFKCVEGQLAKTDGACPKCGRRSIDMKAKYGDNVIEKTDIHIQKRGY